MNETHDKKKNSHDRVDIEIGCRLEAQDKYSGKWFSAKVVDIDELKDTILVHFDRWKSKFDEWLPMSTNRIRSIQKPEPKAEKKFAVGDRVLAAWSVYEKYSATVQKVLTQGKYRVEFDDGFSKILPAGKMWPCDASESAKCTTSGNSAPIGSKQDRRDRKRKFPSVSELFSRNTKKPRLSDSASVASPSTPTAPSTPPVEEKVEKQHTYAQPEAGTTVTVTAFEPDGTAQTWQKYYVIRTKGESAGKRDVVIVNPNNRKFRSKAEILPCLEKHGLTTDDPSDLTDFSTKHHRMILDRIEAEKSTPVVPQVADDPNTPSVIPKAPAATPKTPTAPPKTPTATPKTSTATPKTPTTTAATVKAEKPGKSTPTSVSTPATPVVPESTEEVVVVAGMQVTVLDGQLICPDNSCRKHFRKDSLLQMHMKHYHPKMSKLLTYTPSVTELAYARHVSGLTPSTPEPRTTRLSLPKEERIEVKPRVEIKPKVEPTEPVEMKPSIETKPTVDPKPPPVKSKTAVPETPPQAEIKLEPEPVIKKEPVSSVDQISAAVEALPPRPVTPVAPPPATNTSIPALKTLVVRAHKLENLPGSASSPPSSSAADVENSIRCNIICRSTGQGDGSRSPAVCSTVVCSNPILNTLLTAAPAAQPAEVPGAAHWPIYTVKEEEVQRDIVDVETNDQKYDKLKIYELINCICLIKEEDGMMIQCEVCLCWQHGHCLGYMTEEDVPDAYMCPTCKNPYKGRSSAKYLNHQLWLKKGKLPTLKEKEADERREKREELLRRAFDTSGQLMLLSRVLHSLSVKLTIADNKHHHKLYLWINKWHSALSPSSSPKHEPIEPGRPPKIQPEKPFDPLECKMNLLEHIEKMQEKVQERLNDLEVQVDELEKMQEEDRDGSRLQLQEAKENSSCLVKTTATIKMLLRDLETVEDLAAL